jgi:Uma2 family endonuclease
MTMAVDVARRLFTTKEFEQMIRAGVFLEDERIELIDGEIVQMAPINFPHAICISRLTLFFTKRLGETALVWAQNPIHLPNNTRPQADVVLLRWRDDLYAGKDPTAKDVLLLIEVAESSVRYDQKIKGPRYAAAGILEYWIVNLAKSIVEVYSGLNQDRYESVRTAGRGESLPLPKGLEGSISVDDIFG